MRPFPSRLLFAGLLLLASCGGEDVRTIDRIRIVDGSVRWHATEAERFGFAAPAPPSGFTYRLPDGWEELPPKRFREVNLRAGAAECYLTELPGAAGGLAANVNRWRAQLELPPLGADALAKLPRRPFLGAEAVHVDFSGGGRRLLGLLLVGGTTSRFLKMTGPEQAVDGDAFLDLADSFASGKQASADDGGAGTLGQAELAWTAPDGWRRGPARSMRLVTYFAGKAECYVAVLGGDGGGVVANANRWRGQMGAPPYGRDEFARLPRLDVLGGEAVVVEARGRYRGMGGEEVDDAALLGAIRILRRGAVFVKMVGPAADVDAARADFETFCRSLRRAR